MVKFDDIVEYENENQACSSGRHIYINRSCGNDAIGRNPTERKFPSLLIVSFGLLCLLQATLNITLRLTLPTIRMFPDGCEDVIQNLAAENEELKRTQNILVDGWFYFRNHFYYKSKTKKTWQESRQDCLEKDADLIIINSKEEQEFAENFKRVWIGLTDNETEGIWKWVDGTPLTTHYWHANEPNNVDKSENCGELFFEDFNNWNDRSCLDQNYWICEKIM